MVPQLTSQVPHHYDEDPNADSDRTTDIEEGDSESDEENNDTIGISAHKPIDLPCRPEIASLGFEGESSHYACS